jgi:hypothetical protein
VTCSTLVAAGRSWRFCPVDPPPEAGLDRVLMQARILDDLTLAPPRVPLRTTAARPQAFRSVVGPDGLVGLAGTPWPLLPAAQAAGTILELRIEAPGHEPLSLAGVLPAQPGYPTAFQPLDLGTCRLVRNPVELRGRVTRRVAGTDQPVVGAAVAVTAAVPAPPLTGAQPVPPAAGSFLALATVTDGSGTYRLGPVTRALRLTVTASEGGDSTARSIATDDAEPVVLLDFTLP